MKKCNSKDHKRCLQVWHNTFEKKEMMEFDEPVKFQWKLTTHLDTINLNNCSRIYYFKLQQNLKALKQNYTTTIIRLRLSEDC